MMPTAVVQDVLISVNYNKWTQPLMNGYRDIYGIYIWLLMMLQVLLQALGLTLRKLLTATTMYSIRYLLITVFLISFLPIEELYLLTRKKAPHLMIKTPIHSSLTPASNLVHNLNQAAYHRLKDA